MKLWHIAALVLGVGFIMVMIRNMQATKAVPTGTGASGNDVILGLSKFGSGLIDLGGKIFAPAAGRSSDSDPTLRYMNTDDYMTQTTADGRDYGTG